MANMQVADGTMGEVTEGRGLEAQLDQQADHDKKWVRLHEAEEENTVHSEDLGSKLAGVGLEAFLIRCPMDGWALDRLEACTADILARVVSEFKPRVEGRARRLGARDGPPA